MRYFYILIFLVFATFSLVHGAQTVQEHSVDSTSFSSEELLVMKPREIAKKTGVKLNFFERLLIRKIQKKVVKNGSQENSSLGTASLVLGLISIVSIPLLVLNPIFILVSLFGGIIGALLGATGMRKLEGNELKNAKAGFWLSMLGASLMLAGILVFFFSWGA